MNASYSRRRSSALGGIEALVGRIHAGFEPVPPP
jgi:hypothetical protein